MKLALYNVMTHIIDATHEELLWLDQHLSMVDERQMFFKDRLGQTRRREDGGARLRLLNSATRSFPSGVLRNVVTAGTEFKVQISDRRECPVKPDRSADIAWLYDFQREVVEKCWKRTRGIVKSPTGSGKTEIMVAIAKSLDCPWLMLVDDKDLVHNAARRFEKRTGETAGISGDGRWEPDHRFVCATFQTLSRRLRNPETYDETLAWLRTRGGLLVDECHATSADSFYQVVTAIPAYWRFGFSGTPLNRSDEMGIFTIAALGDIITEVSTQLLIERKIIAKPLITMHKVGVKSDKPTFQGAYSEIVVGSKKRNDLLAKLTAESPGPVLVFVRTIKHGRDLAKRIARHGLRTEFIDGKASTEQRDRVVDDLEWGRLDVVVVTKMWQKGKDIPSLGTVINAAGHRSIIPVLQQMGRGMRVVRAPDGTILKDSVVIHDIWDSDNKWLRRHSVARRHAYEAEGHHVTLTKA